ncbi:MAG: prepilin-type N-terminal cleavage/methylation domain-containing protein [Legionellales bacterium]|nr:prepilin-type N-terminal cleavage/methylation domain-containing protein [Legionellales bacterium]
MRNSLAPKGVSLLEIMLVIAVSAVIFIVAVNYYVNVQLSNKINITVLQVKNLYKAGLLYYQQERYNAISTSTSSCQLKTANASNLSTSGFICNLYQSNYIGVSDMLSSWKKGSFNSISLTPGTKNTTMTITLPGLPKQACTVIQNRLSAIFISSTSKTTANRSFSISPATCPTGTADMTITFIIS